MLQEQLKDIDIFSSLSDEEIQKITAITTLKTLNRDNILFYEGEDTNYFYILLKGSIKLYKTDLKGNELVLHYFTASSMIAEMATLERMKFPATALALQDETVVARIDRSKFIDLLESNSRLSLHIIKSLTKKIKQLETTINRNLVYDATMKVCSFIKEHPRFLEKTKNREIANRLNMAPETLSRILSKLKKIKVLDKQNRLIDREKLMLFMEY